MGVLRLILWDQLSHEISSLQNIDKKKDLIVFLETLHEATYVRHHLKKLVFLFSAMRHFAEELIHQGFTVHYTTIAQQELSLTSGLQKVLEQFSLQKILVTQPGEHRILKEIESWQKLFKKPVEICEDTRFFCNQNDFKQWASKRKTLLMEQFYRFIRKKSGLLMDDALHPIGGMWNYDKENRTPYKKDIPKLEPYKVKPDAITKAVIKEVKAHFPTHFGEVEPFWFAVTRKEALKAFDRFLQEALPYFGSYQDTMSQEDSFLYHSVLSHYINCGLLGPQEVCKGVEKAYFEKKVPINSAEGYIRQLIGWREYIRGIYWLKMPLYPKNNFFGANRPLPQFYWTAETKMNCLRRVVEQTIKEAYSHHIQRLMITGNFALLTGILPEEICKWYLIAYADAHEWVELPNTLGMSQFADGGLLATKPYISSGSYINKMSNFCSDCHYDVNKKSGKEACPFNYLYWDFLIRHEEKLKKNARMRVAYQLLKKFPPDKKKQIRSDASKFLKELA